MNEQFELDSEMVREWLERGGRKQAYLSRELRISESLVDLMLGKRHVPKKRTVQALAQLMGVQVDSLLIPKEAKRA